MLLLPLLLSVVLLFEFFDVFEFCRNSEACQVEDVVKLQGTMPMFFNGAKVSDKLYKMLRDHQAWSELPKHSINGCGE